MGVEIVTKWDGYKNETTGVVIIKDSGLKTDTLKKLYLCKCECGNEFHGRLDDIKIGKIKSCGCKHIRLANKQLHYDRALEIHRRCNNPNAINYKDYGGRGITCFLGVDAKSIASELENLPGYVLGLQLDRIDVNGHYTFHHPTYGNELYYDEHGHICRGNLRWVTPQFNNINKRTSLSLEDLATKYRPYRDICRALNAHNFNLNEFMFHFVHSPEQQRHLAIAVHFSIRNNMTFNDYPWNGSTGQAIWKR